MAQFTGTLATSDSYLGNFVLGAESDGGGSVPGSGGWELSERTKYEAILDHFDYNPDDGTPTNPDLLFAPEVIDEGGWGFLDRFRSHTADDFEYNPDDGTPYNPALALPSVRYLVSDRLVQVDPMASRRTNQHQAHVAAILNCFILKGVILREDVRSWVLGYSPADPQAWGPVRPDTIWGALDQLLGMIPSGGGSSATFVTRETPSGAVDGVNDTYTLSGTPVVGSEHVYLNGVLMDEGGSNDYTIAGGTITMVQIPQTGDKLRVSYRV